MVESSELSIEELKALQLEISELAKTNPDEASLRSWQLSHMLAQKLEESRIRLTNPSSITEFRIKKLRDQTYICADCGTWIRSYKIVTRNNHYFSSHRTASHI